MEEQLAFPSGTATAQLISVLHELPPPDTSVRRRRGYAELEQDEFAREPLNGAEAAEDAELLSNERLKPANAKSEGWAALTWSFAGSAVMTVSRNSSLTFGPANRFVADSLLLPCAVLITLVWAKSGARMALDLYTQSIIHWPG